MDLRDRKRPRTRMGHLNQQVNHRKCRIQPMCSAFIRKQEKENEVEKNIVSASYAGLTCLTFIKQEISEFYDQVNSTSYTESGSIEWSPSNMFEYALGFATSHADSTGMAVHSNIALHCDPRYRLAAGREWWISRAKSQPRQASRSFICMPYVTLRYAY